MSMSDEDDPAHEDSFWGRLDGDSTGEDSAGEPAEGEPADWSGDELEEAYLRAMEVLEASEAQFPELPPVPEPVPEVDATPPQNAAVLNVATLSALPMSAVPDRIHSAELAAELTELTAEAARRQSTTGPQPAAVTPRQILEAMLFVGGEPLTIKKLFNVLRGEFSTEYIESQLDELNSLYVREGRPYEIRLGDGGYRLALREDFEKIRRKTYGLGPKEVKLSQDAIEVLAVVAYHQPLSAAAIEELGKPGCSGVLRQLLRRELIAVERSPARAREVAYRTTPRFLSLFGIRSLNELPRLEQVGYK